MFNYASNNKRISFAFIFILLIFAGISHGSNFAYAKDDALNEELSSNIDQILKENDFSDLDDYVLVVPDLNFSFKDFVKSVINGEFKFDYFFLDSYIKTPIINYLRSNLRFFTSLFIIVFLYEIFKAFSGDSLSGVKSSLKLIFSFILALLILGFIKSFFVEISKLIDDLFLFASKLFPLLIALLALSGAAKSATVFSSFSIFLLETGSYLIKFVLLPLSVSILLLSLFLLMYICLYLYY